MPKEELDELAWSALVLVVYFPVGLGSALWLWYIGGAAHAWIHIVGYAPGRDLLVGALIGGGIAFASQVSAKVWAPMHRMVDVLSSVIGPISFCTCTLLALSSSVAEELLFRGVLQPSIGLLPASLLFAVVHVPMERALWLWPVFAFAMGLLLGGLYEWSGAVAAPIATHFVINLLNLYWLASHARREAGLSQ